MGWTYDQLIAELTVRYGYANSHRFALNNYRQTAFVRWGLGDDHGAIESLIEAMNEANDAFGDMFAKSYYGWNGSTYVLPTALDRNKACPFITEAPPVDVTMAAVLSAMITADFDELQKFIGIVDAYRVSLWNAPFNAEFYAALARGFSP